MCLLDDLVSRAPDDLKEVLRDTVRRSQRSPASGVELLDAIDEAHVGLGVAIGRGSLGDEQTYEQLGRLCRWLYDELGQPESACYAVVRRVSSKPEADDQAADAT